MSIVIEQCLFERADFEEPQLLGRSRGFADDWLPAARELVLGFGNRPAGVRCPLAVFAVPLSKTHVAIVQTADQQVAGKSGLAFAIFALPRKLYTNLFGDPFWIANQLPANFQSRGDLPQLSLPATPIPMRTVADLERVLKRVRGKPLADDVEVKEQTPTIENSESPALLGAVQILVDGGQVAFERPSADTGLIPDLWLLLPHSTRSHLWPASFAFCNDLRFDALATPNVVGQSFTGYADEDHAADYPEGRYEYLLQRAVESGDQGELDALLTRRSANETWKLAVALLLFVSVAAFVTNNFRLPPQPVDVESKAALAAGAVSAGDPWTALSLIRVGEAKWKR